MGYRLPFARSLEGHPAGAVCFNQNHVCCLCRAAKLLFGQRADLITCLLYTSYGEPVEKNGLNLLTGPGNDQVSCTNLTASGAQMILFTTCLLYTSRCV